MSRCMFNHLCIRSYPTGLLPVTSAPFLRSRGCEVMVDENRPPSHDVLSDHHRPEELPWVAELARQVGEQLGAPDGDLVFDPSAFPKKGNASVGVQRQWCGRLGKVDNCPVGVYLAYVGPT